MKELIISNYYKKLNDNTWRRVKMNIFKTGREDHRHHDTQHKTDGLWAFIQNGRVYINKGIINYIIKIKAAAKDIKVEANV